VRTLVYAVQLGFDADTWHAWEFDFYGGVSDDGGAIRR
jgi:hypothetical protein